MFEPLSYNPYKEFIGRTIKDIKYYGQWADLEFEDGTKASIDIGIPGTLSQEQKDQLFISGTFFN